MSAISNEFDDSIPGDNTFAQVAACIPVVGTIVSIVEQYLINRQIDQVDLHDASRIPRMIELIKVKNEYKLIGVLRGVLTIALLICLVFVAPLALLLIMPTLYLSGIDLVCYFKNRNRIQELKNGWPANFVIY